MEKLWYKKHLGNTIFALMSFVVMFAIGILFLYAGIFSGAISICISLIFAAIAGYRLVSLVNYRKKTWDMLPSEAVIANWQIGGYKSRVASVSIKVDYKEYFSPTYFGIYEAEYMVGHKVSYVIVDETLLIYEVLT